WILKDVCNALEISNSGNVAARLDDDEKADVHIMDTSSNGITQMRSVTVINESALYKTIMLSRKLESKKFQRWVTHEVLPSIRRHGAYLTVDKARELMNDPDAWISLISALKKEKIKNECLQAQIEEDRPKVTFANAVTASDKSTITVGELAKILKSNEIDIGQNRLYEKLRREGFIIRNGLSRHNAPTQEAMNRGLFAFNKIAYAEDDGSVVFSYAPRVTAKGQRYFVNYFLSQKGGEDATNQ
ncbi:MAG: phage antirepressor KilAC domain-containing protein, partial [Holosporaceae bacterium]|nr:phage antirepressor KilAC domain-containing protein [Holosporaceae bacterium]